MTFKMYKYTGQRNVINKSITHVADLSNGYFKNDTDFINPVLVLSTSFNITNENYFSIDGLYYFVNEVTRSQQNQVVQLELDDLESYKTSILDQSCIIERSSNNFNLYQEDPDIPSLKNNDITQQLFPGAFTGESLILITAGGEPTP